MSTRGRAAHTCKVFGEPCDTDVDAGRKGGSSDDIIQLWAAFRLAIHPKYK
ncbi:hypothetical protein [Paenibacillus peoriae]|uniref:hypothetical protein n=1 Tax=Paenibacillus peoriae TaxID=59893 RepID=UPI0015E29F16|nr:hypothetical protein [Paenibacillus peoriae]